MVEEKDIRWVLRFDNYRKALRRLKQAVKILSGKPIYYPLFLDFERTMLPLSGLEPSLS